MTVATGLSLAAEAATKGMSALAARRVCLLAGGDVRYSQDSGHLHARDDG